MSVLTVRSHRRWPVSVLGLLGVALIVAPVVFGMFRKAPEGASMMTAFTPFMTTHRLSGFQSEMQMVRAAVTQGQRAIHTVGHTPAGAASFRKVAEPFAAFVAQWRGVDADMGGMLRTIRANLPDYQAVSALPSFRLFPWFFVIPGAILLVLAALGLLLRRSWASLRWVAAVIGIGLILAPIGFQMFSRGPEGAHMLSTFRTIETTHHLRRIQSYFSEMAEGQGAVQLGVIPALKHAGLSSREINARYPGLQALDHGWVHMLNDMTPMIAVMSDNIVNYQAVSSLPSFRLFPWFFLLPGVIVLGLALTSDGHDARGARGEAPDTHSSVISPVQQGVA